MLKKAMLTATHRPLTVHDYYTLPAHGPQYQLVEGKLYMAPAPNRFHQVISGNLEFILRTYLKHKPLGKIYDAPFDVHLSDVNVYQPDMLFLAKEHYALETQQGLRGAPDLVVEILSPKTADLDVGVKREVYARCGVEEFWVIDPENLRISIFRLQENAETPVMVVGSSGEWSTCLLPGLVISAEDVFRD